MYVSLLPVPLIPSPVLLFEGSLRMILALGEADGLVVLVQLLEPDKSKNDPMERSESPQSSQSMEFCPLWRMQPRSRLEQGLFFVPVTLPASRMS